MFAKGLLEQKELSTRRTTTARKVTLVVEVCETKGFFPVPLPLTKLPLQTHHAGCSVDGIFVAAPKVSQSMFKARLEQERTHLLAHIERSPRGPRRS